MKKRLLIVDDQYGIRNLLSELFIKDGYETCTAATGKEAIEIVQNEKIDLILLDIKIPGMDGIDILNQINKMNKDVKVIMMTAYGELNLLGEAMEKGAVAYFLKPFDIHEIRQKVKKELY